MKKEDVNARNILLEILNDMLWAAEPRRSVHESHFITPMPVFARVNPEAFHEAIAAFQGLIDQLETEAARQEPVTGDSPDGQPEQ